MDDINTAFAEFVDYHMKDQGLSINKLYVKTGVYREFIRDIKHRQIKHVKLDMACKVLHTLGLTLSDFDRYINE